MPAGPKQPETALSAFAIAHLCFQVTLLFHHQQGRAKASRLYGALLPVTVGQQYQVSCTCQKGTENKSHHLSQVHHSLPHSDLR